jgi:predicted subunit of tRNA(5-methylaminomethyl-2-thiouridylate) methyltransferase
MTEKLALVATPVVDGVREDGCGQGTPDLGDHLHGQGTEIIVDADLMAATALSIPDGTRRDDRCHHLLEAQCLSTELHVGRPTVGPTYLVFDRNEGSVGMDLDGIRSAAKP